jgi:ribonuclease HI
LSGSCFNDLPDCIPTNSINELLAIKHALLIDDGADEINIISDSQYAIQMTFTNREKIQRRDGKNKWGKPIKH